MDRQTILILLQRRPFEPFSLQLSNGTSVDVRHPELAALGKSRLVVVNPETDTMEIISFLHVASVRTLQAA
jgi:hypothetical protein